MIDHPGSARSLFVTLALLCIAPASAQQWTQLAPAVSPPPRNSHAMVWDSARGVAVMYGGFLFPNTFYSDTWEWDGTTWTLRPAAGGTARNGHAMAYDSVRSVTVLFGGGTLQGMGDTWEYDGTTWTRRATTGPSPRMNHQMCFDAARGVTVLFGGHFSHIGNGALGDTWEWNGTTWTQRAPATSPSARVYHAMEYDSHRGVSVLFGGREANGALLDETWEWDGSNWTRRFSAHTPSSRTDHEMAYDPIRRRCVVHSGTQSTGPSTWEWDGTDWTPGGAMPGLTTTHHAYGFCFDDVNDRVLLFGGFRAGQNAETWHYGPSAPASYTLRGTGCPGVNGTPAIAAVSGSSPRLGQTFSVAMNNLGPLTLGILGLSDVQLASVPLPLDLGLIGMPNCRLYVSLEVSFGFTTPTGSGTWDLAVPNTPSLVGFRFHQQLWTLATGVNPLGFATSNYGTAVLGA